MKTRQIFVKRSRDIYTSSAVQTASKLSLENSVSWRLYVTSDNKPFLILHIKDSIFCTILNKLGFLGRFP